MPSGGAELAAAIGAVSADHLAAPSEAGIDALAAAAADGQPVVATVLPATTWFDEAAPRAGPDVHRARHPGRDRDGLQPGHLADAVVAARDDRCLSEPGADAGRGFAATTINAAFAVGRGEDVGSIEGGKAADLVIWRVPTSRQIPYWPAADLVRTVVKRGRVVFERA